MPLDDDLGARFAALPVRLLDVDADLARVRAHTERTRRHRRVIAALATALVVVLLGAGITLLTRPDDDRAPRSVVARPSPTGSTPSSTPTPTAPSTTLLPPDVQPIPGSAITEFPLGSDVGLSAMALGHGSVWLGGFDQSKVACHLGCGVVSRLDPETGRVVASITIAKAPRAMAYGDGALWMEAEVPDNSSAIVVKVDPATNQVVAQSDIPGTSIAGSTGHPRIAVGGHAVWVAYGDELVKIDPATGSVIASTKMTTYAEYIVANDAGVWVIGEPQGVAQVDPDTLALREFAVFPPGFIQSSTLDGDTIWLTAAHNVEPTGATIELIKIDTRTGQVTYTGIPTANVVAGGGRVWFQGFAAATVAATHPDEAVEIDPGTGRMIRAARVGIDEISPPLLAVDANTVWLLTQDGLIRIRA